MGGKLAPQFHCGKLIPAFIFGLALLVPTL